MTITFASFADVLRGELVLSRFGEFSLSGRQAATLRDALFLYLTRPSLLGALSGDASRLLLSFRGDLVLFFVSLFVRSSTCTRPVFFVGVSAFLWGDFFRAGSSIVFAITGDCFKMTGSFQGSTFFCGRITLLARAGTFTVSSSGRQTLTFFGGDGFLVSSSVDLSHNVLTELPCVIADDPGTDPVLALLVRAFVGDGFLSASLALIVFRCRIVGSFGGEKFRVFPTFPLLAGVPCWRDSVRARSALLGVNLEWTEVSL